MQMIRKTQFQASEGSEDESKGKKDLQTAYNVLLEDSSNYAKAAKVALKKLNKSETDNTVVVDQLKVARKGIKQ